MTLSATAKTIAVMMLWASCFPLISAGIEYSPHLSFAALRALIAGVTLTILARALRRSFPIGFRMWIALVLIGVGATSLGFLGMFHAAEFVSPGIATVIANTQPLLAAVLAVVVLNERLSVTGKIGLSLGFLGVVTIVLPTYLADETRSYGLGIAYIVLAAVGVTVSNVLIKRIAGEVDALMAMGIQMLIGSLPLLGSAIAFENPHEIEWSLSFVTILLSLSLFGSALVYWLWFSVLTVAPLGQANSLSFLIPIFGLSLGVIFYGEELGWVQLTGIVVTVLGVGLVARGGTTSPNTDDVRDVRRL